MARAIRFTRLADGTVLRRQPDGSYRPARTRTDWKRIAALTDAEIERLAASDPDHPPLDAAFWAGVDKPRPVKEGISIKLDRDVLAWFRRQGRGYQTRMNAVLRRYMEAQRKAG